ncbi:MAG: FHA domain-containing protein [Hyphomonas sp.]|uniref:FHA domain-containing protein n=1 Tax=Hyphomonas sp. TaxID=87 RepID=UPI003298A036
MNPLKTVFQPRALRLRIQGGTDNGKILWLHGERLTIGSNPDSDLRLFGPGVLPEHLVLTSSARRKGPVASRLPDWNYSLSDDPDNQVDKQPAPRGGQIGSDQMFRLGAHTELVIENAAVDDDTPRAAYFVSGSGQVPGSKIWALRLFKIIGMLAAFAVIVLVAFLNIVNSAAVTGPVEKQANLTLENIYCAVVREDQLEKTESPLMKELAECLRLDGPEQVRQRDRDDLRRLIVRAYLHLNAGDTTAASHAVAGIERRLGGSECRLVAGLRRDINLLPERTAARTCE